MHPCTLKQTKEAHNALGAFGVVEGPVFTSGAGGSFHEEDQPDHSRTPSDNSMPLLVFALLRP